MRGRSATGARRFRALVLAAGAAVAAAAPAAAQSPEGGAAATPPLGVELRAEPIGFTPPNAVSVRVTRPAHVAVFEVRPGVGAVLRHPGVRDGGTRLSPGVHRLALDAGRGAFERRRGIRALPGRGRLSPDRPRDLGRPYLLVVASRDRLWLSGHRLGRIFRPRDVRLSVPFLVDAVLRDVVPHPDMEPWAFDLRPGVPRLGPHRFGRPAPPLPVAPGAPTPGRGDAPPSP